MSSSAAPDFEKLLKDLFNTIKLPVSLHSCDLPLFYDKVQENGGYSLSKADGDFVPRSALQCGVSVQNASKLCKLYERHVLPFDLHKMCWEYISAGPAGPPVPEARLEALRRIVHLMDFWLDWDGPSKRPFDIVALLWKHLGAEQPHDLAKSLTAVLEHCVAHARDALRLMQELSYEHEDFARALVTGPAARLLVQRTQYRHGRMTKEQEAVQVVACKTLQNVSWWKDHARPLLDASIFEVMVELLEEYTPVLNVNVKEAASSHALLEALLTAALSALANITDHETRHCSALLKLRSLDFWVALLSNASFTSRVRCGACHVLESLVKNAPHVRARLLAECGGLEALCDVLVQAQTLRDSELAAAVVQCLGEACVIAAHRNVVLTRLRITDFAQASKTVPAALEARNASSSSAPNTRGRGGGVVGSAPATRKRARSREAASAAEIAAGNTPVVAAVAPEMKRARPEAPTVVLQQRHIGQTAPLMAPPLPNPPPTLDLREINASDAQVRQVTGSASMPTVASNAVLEMLMNALKQERQEHLATKLKLRELENFRAAQTAKNGSKKKDLSLCSVCASGKEPKVNNCSSCGLVYFS